MTIRVVVGNDKAFVRAGLTKILEDDRRISVIGEVSTGVEALNLARNEHPDVLVLDAHLPQLDGLEVTRRLNLNGSRVILIVPENQATGIIRALQAGARGVITETPSADALVHIVHAVNTGSTVLAHAANTRLIEVLNAVAHMSAPTWRNIRPAALTQREREVFSCLGDGLANNEIARQLGIEVSTVKSHVAHLLTKLRIRDRTQAALLAHDVDRHATAFGTNGGDGSKKFRDLHHRMRLPRLEAEDTGEKL